MFINKFLRWGALTTISISLIACQSTNEQATTKSVTTVPLTLERMGYFLHPYMYLGGVGRPPPKYLSQLPTDF